MSTDFEIVSTLSKDIAFLNYTSGTTGNPKGVIHSHSWGYIHQIVAAKQWLGIQEGDVVWGTAAPGWGKWTWTPFLSALGSGATSISYLGTFNPKKYMHIINEYQVNVLCCTPTEYRMLVKLPHLEQYNLSSLRYAVSAGEALNPQVIEKFKEQFGVTIRDGYGQTETTLLIATLADMEEKRGSMGKPTPENIIAIIDEDGNTLPSGEVGHIAVHKDSPALFKGYLNEPERTASSFKGDWYLTGDLASMDKDGYYWYKGRADDVIISSGYTIGPAEVEDALDIHPAVQESAVVASPDEVRGFIVKAFVVLKDPKMASDALIKELQHHVKRVTAAYKYPREIEFIAELPRTISNKVRRVVLRELERSKKLAF
jgi:acetyl-CoA synthetase